MSAVLKSIHGASIDHCGMTLTSELVTPALAAEWLSRNACNRRLRPQVVDNYSRDQASGNWMPIPVAVCLLPDGSLGNAQHTLSAIVKSGKSLRLLVARNVPYSSIAVMDRGIQRTVSDVAHFLGMNFESRRAAIAKACHLGCKLSPNSAMTFHELWGVYEQHKLVVDFAFELSPKKGPAGVNTTMLGIVARAAYTQNKERLAKFVHIIINGVCESSSDQAAIRYRDWASGFSSSMVGSRGVNQVYRRAQAALKHFIAGAPITKLYGIEGDVFEIPR